MAWDRTSARGREKDKHRLAMFIEHEPEAIKMIVSIAMTSTDEERRLRACQYIVDRARGKVPEPAKVLHLPPPTEGGGRPSLAMILGIDLIAAAPVEPAEKTINGTAEEG